MSLRDYQSPTFYFPTQLMRPACGWPGKMSFLHYSQLPVACTFPRCDSTSDQLGTFLCRIFAVFDPRSAVPWYLASVGTILDLLLYIYFLYSQPQTQRYREEFPGLRSQWGSVQPIPCVLQHSALACVFSNSSIICSK